MKTYTILKSFHGSQDGLHTEEFAAGTTTLLSDSLAAIALAEGWVELIAEEETRETKVEAPAETKPAPSTRKRK